MTPAKKAAKKSAKKSPGKSAPRKKAAVKKTVKKGGYNEKTTAKYVAMLDRAGLVDGETISADHRRLLSRLSAAEVRALISVKKKLGFEGSLDRDGADFF